MFLRTILLPKSFRKEDLPYSQCNSMAGLGTAIQIFSSRALAVSRPASGKNYHLFSARCDTSHRNAINLHCEKCQHKVWNPGFVTSWIPCIDGKTQTF